MSCRLILEFSVLAKHQASCKVSCQPGDYRWSLHHPQGFVWLCMCLHTHSMIYWSCWTKSSLRMIAYLTILLIECFTFWFKKQYIYSFEIVVFGNNFCHIYGHVDLGHIWAYEMNLRMKHVPELGQSLNLLVCNH